MVKALKKIGYAGFVSAEALPWPDSLAAARQAMLAYQRYFNNADS